MYPDWILVSTHHAGRSDPVLGHRRSGHGALCAAVNATEGGRQEPYGRERVSVMGGMMGAGMGAWLLLWISLGLAVAVAAGAVVARALGWRKLERPQIQPGAPSAVQEARGPAFQDCGMRKGEIGREDYLQGKARWLED